MIDKNRLQAKCSTWNIPLTGAQLDLLDRYAELLVSYNEKVNLTAITSPEGIEDRHFADSLLFAAQPEVSGRLVDDDRWALFCRDCEVKQAELHRLETTSIKLADLRAAAPEGAELGEIGGSAIELMRRPYISYDLIAKVIGRGEGVTPAMAQRIETEIRYAGYIAREERIIRDIQRHENVKIPDDFDYAPIETMTLESREKLTKIRPRTLAQAGRIPGVSPSDLAQLSIVLLKLK